MKPVVACTSLLLAAALGGAIGHGIGAAPAPPAPLAGERTDTDGATAAALRDLTTRLASLERALAAAAPPARQEVPRADTAAAPAAIDPLLDRLTTLVAWLTNAQAGAGHEDLRRARSQNPAPNLPALRLVHERLRAEAELPVAQRPERRNWLLHTMAEVVAQLGVPTVVSSTQHGGSLWEYYVGDDQTVYFQFRDGIVIGVDD